MASRPPPPAECAQCGAEIPPRALACPECGADERTGWRETSIYDGLDLPDSDDDTPDTPPRGGLRWYWIVAAAVVLAVLILGGLALR